MSEMYIARTDLNLNYEILNFIFECLTKRLFIYENY